MWIRPGKLLLISTTFFFTSLLSETSFGYQIDFSSLTSYPIEFLQLKRLEGKVNIDGELESKWQQATELPAFVQTRGKEFGAEARFQTQTYGFLTEDKLYLAFVCHEPEPDQIVTQSTFWDDPSIIYDDRVEIFIDPDHDHRTYYHLALNADGIQFDQEILQRYPKTRTDERSAEWNCYWKARTKKEEQRWVAEVEIDLKSLTANSLNNLTSWGFNVGRARRPQPAMERGEQAKVPLEDAEYSAWKYTRDGIWETVSNFFEPTEFGDLLFKPLDFTIESIYFRNASFVYGGKNVPTSQVGRNPIIISFDQDILIDDGIDLRLRTISEEGERWEQVSPIDTKYGKQFHSQYFIHQSAGESTLSIELLDRATEEILYQSSYVLTIPPFIRYNLADLYTQFPDTIGDIPFALVSDDSTLAYANLKLNLYDHQNQQRASQFFEQVSSAQKSLSFDAQAASPDDRQNFSIEAILLQAQTLDTISRFIQPFTLNKREKNQKFEAKLGNYRYGGLEGDAVQILFPNGQRFVFWEKASYVPWWDVDQVAVSFGYAESAGLSTQGCAEALQDRECRYSQVEVLEQSPARIVIHWRYALTDAHYKIHNNEWVDEYYFFYPDGVGIRQVNLGVNQAPKHTYEFFEVMIVSPPAVEVTDVFKGAVAELNPLNGNDAVSTQTMSNKGAEFYETFIQKSEDVLVGVNLHNRETPFAVITFRDSINSGSRDRLPSLGYSVDYANTNNRGHWPASEFAVDGYNLVGNHRPTHGNIGSVFQSVNPQANPNQFSVMIGVEEDSSSLAQAHGKSWLNPAMIVHATETLSFLKYDVGQRAYILSASNPENLEFEFEPIDAPVLNPVFIINNVSDKQVERISLGGQELKKGSYQTGHTKDNELIIFLEKEVTHQQSIQITFNAWDH